MKPVILCAAILLGGCTMTHTIDMQWGNSKAADREQVAKALKALNEKMDKQLRYRDTALKMLAEDVQELKGDEKTN